MIGLNRILVGDAFTTVQTLPAAFVDCVVTSPPYFQLRNYQHPGQLGLEETAYQWVGRSWNCAPRWRSRPCCARLGGPRRPHRRARTNRG